MDHEVGNQSLIAMETLGQKPFNPRLHFAGKNIEALGEEETYSVAMTITAKIQPNPTQTN